MEVILGSIRAIPQGEGRNFAVGSAEIAVFRDRDGGVYATQALCPHRGGRLADGLLGAGQLVCPLHSLKFDLSTGLAHSSECSLKLYPVRLNEAGQIVVDLESP